MHLSRVIPTLQQKKMGISDYPMRRNLRLPHASLFTQKQKFFVTTGFHPCSRTRVRQRLSPTVSQLSHPHCPFVARLLASPVVLPARLLPVAALLLRSACALLAACRACCSLHALLFFPMFLLNYRLHAARSRPHPQVRGKRLGD